MWPSDIHASYPHLIPTSPQWGGVSRNNDRCIICMPRLACDEKHRKSVCDKWDLGTHCTKCCRCIDRRRGRPKKVALPISAAARVNLNESMLNLPSKTMKMMIAQVYHSSIAQLKHRY